MANEASRNRPGVADAACRARRAAAPIADSRVGGRVSEGGRRLVAINGLPPKTVRCCASSWSSPYQQPGPGPQR
jgi:hypothetical protein